MNSKQATHTPGPWTVVRNGDSNALIRYSDGENASYIAQCNDLQLCPEHGTVEANARLIAAAPDLLAALEELLADKYLADPINADRMANARAAIAKAKGQ